MLYFETWHQELVNSPLTRSASLVWASESEGRAQDVVRFVEMLGRFPFEFLVLPGDDETASFAFELMIVQMFQQGCKREPKIHESGGMIGFEQSNDQQVLQAGLDDLLGSLIGPFFFFQMTHRWTLWLCLLNWPRFMSFPQCSQVISSLSLSSLSFIF